MTCTPGNLYGTSPFISQNFIFYKPNSYSLIYYMKKEGDNRSHLLFSKHMLSIYLNYFICFIYFIFLFQSNNLYVGYDLLYYKNTTFN